METSSTRADLQSALLSAIDYLANEKINQLTLDKTVVMTIVATQDVIKNTYKVRYQGNDNLVAFGLNGNTYSAGQSVYVLIPQNDLSKDKSIIGVASSSKSDETSSFVSSIMDGYTYVGGSLISLSDIGSNKSIGLHSWRESDSHGAYLSDEFKKELQKSYEESGGKGVLDTTETTWYKYNDNEGKSCAKNAKKLLVRAKFRTDLTGSHKLLSCGGEYGIEVVARFKTKDSYREVLKWVAGSNGSTGSWEPTGETVSGSVEPGKIETGSDGDEKKVSDELKYKTKKQVFSLDTSSGSFTGQPFNYPSFSSQYAVFDFDAENFEAIDSVIVYSKGFKPPDSSLRDVIDIYIKDIEIYGLAEVSSVNGDYSLKMSPKTITFDAVTPNGVTDSQYVGTVQAVFKKKSLSLSRNSSTSFYWGVEDKSVTNATSEGYHGYLGNGWRKFDNKGSTCEFKTSKAENRGYETKYRCSAVYMSSSGEKIALRDDFIVYNLESKRDIKITSDLGEEFEFNRGIPLLTCFVEGYAEEADVPQKDEKGDDVIDSATGLPVTKSNEFSHYSFYWSISQNGSTRDIVSEADAQKEFDNIQKKFSSEDKTETVSYSEYAQAKSNLDLAAGVKFGKNKEDGKEDNSDRNHLQFPVSAIASSATITCTVYRDDTFVYEDGGNKSTGSSYCVGSATITLVNASSTKDSQCTIIIENSDQSFQYSEAGVSPCKEDFNGLQTQEILPLSCHFYDPTGQEVAEDQYTLSWIVPTEDTFFTFDKDGETIVDKNSAASTGEKIITTRVLEFGIQDQWKYAYTARQITAVVTYKNDNNKEFRKDTEFLFSKVGDNGTNGTEYVLKIEPRDESWYPFGGGGDAAYQKTSYLPEVVFVKEASGSASMINIPKLTAELYKSGTKAPTEAKNTNFSMAESVPNTAIYPFEINDLQLCFSSTKDEGIGFDDKCDFKFSGSTSWQRRTKFFSPIIKASTEVNASDDEKTWDMIYAFYPVPIVISNGYAVTFSRKYTMQQILYNADGKYPQYDADQGVKIESIYKTKIGDDGKFSFTEVTDYTDFHVDMSLVGGFSDLKQYVEKEETKVTESADEDEDNGFEEKTTYKEIVSNIDSDLSSITELDDDDSAQPLRRHVLIPKETYSGQYQNNAVKVVLRNVNDTEEIYCVAYVPIYMSLNRYTLASLNKWDGNSLKINDSGKDSYILAPQIGAGVKNEDNSFTGMVMGTAVSTVEDEKGNVGENRQVGLLGYSKGKQSVFIDAETGNATFGLRSSDFNESDDNSKYSGRIELRPRGRSKIANLTFTDGAMYGVSKLKKDYRWVSEKDNSKQKEEDLPPEKRAGEFIVDEENPGKTISYWPAREKITNPDGTTTLDNTKWIYEVISTPDSIEMKINDNFSNNRYKEFMIRDTEIGDPYTDYPIPGATFGIPYDSEGVLINSVPGYISIKGHPLSRYNSTIDFDNANKSLNEGDCLELEMDPSKSSLFTIYRHYRTDKGKEKRAKMVGIDSTGKFYTNSVRDDKASMTIAKVAGFGFGAGEDSDNFWSGKTNLTAPEFPNYIGVNFSYENGSNKSFPIIKMFQSMNSGQDRDTNTYLTKGYDINSEYDQGGIRINAQKVELYAEPSSSNIGDAVATTTNCCLKVNKDSYFFGTDDFTKTGSDGKKKNIYGSYLKINRSDSAPTILLQNGEKNKLFLSKDEVRLQRDNENGCLIMGTNLSKFSYNGSTYLAFDPNGNNTSGKKGVVLQYNDKLFLHINSSSAIISAAEGEGTDKSPLISGSITIKPKAFVLNINSKKKIGIDADNIAITGSKTGETSIIDKIVTVKAVSKEANDFGQINLVTKSTDKDSKENGTSSIFIDSAGDINLTSSKGSTFQVYYDLITHNINNLSGSLVGGSLAISGNVIDKNHKTEVNNALCFVGATYGLRLERYIDTTNHETTDTYRILRTATDTSHAFEVGGATLIEGALKAMGGAKTTNLVIYNNGDENNGKQMNKGWFDAIQTFYDTEGVIAGRQDGNTLCLVGRDGKSRVTYTPSFTDTNTKYSLKITNLSNENKPTSSTTLAGLCTWALMVHSYLTVLSNAIELEEQ